MEKKVIILLLLFINVMNRVESQTTNEVNFYGKREVVCHPKLSANLESEKQANDIVAKICNVMRTPHIYAVVECNSISNCKAIRVDDVDYILFNRLYLDRIKGYDFAPGKLDTNDIDWIDVGILAHEVGHHYLHHLTSKVQQNDLSDKQRELQADEFSGEVLRKLGCPSEDHALMAVNSYTDDPNSISHPRKSERIQAVKKGYNSVGKIVNPPPANNDRDGDGVLDRMDKCPDKYGPVKNEGCPITIDPKPVIKKVENPNSLTHIDGYEIPGLIILPKDSIRIIDYGDGRKYHGYVMDGKRVTWGLFYFGNKIYIGDWDNDNINGKGKIVENGETIFEGYFKDGNSHGKGIETKSDGKQYEGKWVNGQKEGEFTMTNPNEYWEKQIYKNDRLIRKAPKGQFWIENKGDW